MIVRLQCPNPDCGKRYRVDDAWPGRRIKCKYCGHEFTVGGPGGRTPLPPPQAQPRRPPVSRPKAGDLSPKTLGRFEIRARLGSGAFGTVYLAHDSVLDRDVALKVPREAALENPEARARFLREPKAAAQLRHPHIVPVYDAGIAGDRYYIASAYIEGRTLQQVIDRGRPDFHRAAEIVRDLAGALDYAHRMGVVHRDVKPANVMIDKTGQALLTDFGLARLESSDEKLTQDGALMGTPAYMAPEQADRSFGEVGPASDQYSLGVVLYELLCGDTPFSGPPTVLLFNIINQEPDPPRRGNASVPKDLETICLKAISKQPQQRYADCGELREDLRRFLAHEPIRARAVGALERLYRWCRRRPTVAGLSAAVAIVALLGLVAVFFSLAMTERVHDTLTQELTQQEQEAAAREAAMAEARQEAENKRLEAENKSSELQSSLALSEQQQSDLRAEAETQAEEARRRAYAQQLSRVATLRDVDPSQAIDLLSDGKRCPSDLRDFTWELLYQLCGRGEWSVEGSNFAFSWDGATLAVAPPGNPQEYGTRGSRAQIRVWDLATRGVRVEFSCYLGSLAFAPDAKSLVIAPPPSEVWDDPRLGVLGPIILREAHTGEQRAVVNDKACRLLAFSPDGSRFLAASHVSAYDYVLKVYGIVDGEEIAAVERPEYGRIGCANFSPDGNSIALGYSHAPHGKTVQWGVYVRHLTRDTEWAQVGFSGTEWNLWPLGVAFSPNGNRLSLVMGLPGDYGVFINHFDAHKRKPDLHEAFRGMCMFGALSEDCQTLAYYSLITPASGPRGRPGIYGPGLRGAAGGTAAGSKNRTTVVVRNLVTGTVRAEIPVPYTPEEAVLALSRSGSSLAIIGDTRPGQGRVSVWDVNRGEQRFNLWTETNGVESASLSRDGRMLAIGGGGKVKLLRVDGESCSATLTGHRGEVWSIAFGVRGRHLYSVGVDEGGSEELVIWDLSSWKGEKVEVSREGFPLVHIHLCQGADTFMTSHGRRTPKASYWGEWSAKIWERANGTERIRLDVACAGPAMISPDGQILVTPVSDGLSFQDTWTGTGHGSIPFPDVRSLAFSPGGSALAGWRRTGDSSEKQPANAYSVSPAPKDPGDEGYEVTLCDLHTGEVRTILGEGPLEEFDRAPVGQRVRGPTMALSADGKTLAVGCRRGNLVVDVWDIPSARKQATLTSQDRVTSAAFSPDGKTLVTGGSLEDGSGQLIFWDPISGRELFVLPAHAGAVSALAFSPDGRILATGSSDGTIRLWYAEEQTDLSHPSVLALDDAAAQSAPGEASLRPETPSQSPGSKPATPSPLPKLDEKDPKAVAERFVTLVKNGQFEAVAELINESTQNRDLRRIRNGEITEAYKDRLQKAFALPYPRVIRTGSRGPIVRFQVAGSLPSYVTLVRKGSKWKITHVEQQSSGDKDMGTPLRSGGGRRPGVRP